MSTSIAKITYRHSKAQYFIERLSDSETLEMVSIPAGQFMMGAPETEEDSRDRERPEHIANIKAFFLGKYSITQGQYMAVMGKNPSKFKAGGEYPVENVRWEDAKEFCRRLSEQSGKEYRLPSEAEWEYACRAGTTTPFHFGETLDARVANYDTRDNYGSGHTGRYRKKTTPVGSFKVANAFGLYDMHGNVSEWCEDVWHATYDGAPNNGSAWIESDGNVHVLRGGAWDTLPHRCRSAFRPHNAGDELNYAVGFRVACVGL